MTRHFDWRAAILHGCQMAGENWREYDGPEPWTAGWELLVEAARISRSFEAPPRSGYPERGSWPETPDEVTPWQRQMAYLRGEVDEVEQDDPPPPAPTAAEVTRAEAVLDLFHRHALMRGQYPHPCKRHIYRLANGAPLGVVMRLSGMKRHEVLAMRRRAAEEILRAAGVSA